MESQSGIGQMKFQDALRFLVEGETPGYFHWTITDMAQAWNSPLIVPKGFNWRSKISNLMLHHLRQERDLFREGAVHPCPTFLETEMPMEVTLQTDNNMDQDGAEFSFKAHDGFDAGHTGGSHIHQIINRLRSEGLEAGIGGLPHPISVCQDNEEGSVPGKLPLEPSRGSPGSPGQ